MVLPDVTYDDVNARYLEGDLADEFDESKVVQQIEDAVDFAASRWLDGITSRLASGALTPNLYKRTISDAVLRVLRNPNGYTSENEGGYGYSRRADVASGSLGFTDADIDTLAGVLTKQIPGTVGIGLDYGWS